MNFSEWLQLDEIRLKGLHRMFRQEHPDMPRYVQNDLYTSRIAHSFNKSLKATSPNNGKTSPNGSGSKLTASSPSEIFNKSGLKGVTWTKRPEFLKGKWGKIDGVTPADFDQDTQWRMLDRRFGMREEKQIRNDLARTVKQRELMLQREDNEPVCVVATNKGYRLLEGWHRTMNYLLKGAPLDQLEILRDGHLQEIDFNKWKPVRIKGYVGQDAGMRASMAGTGQYDPDGTGDYVPENFEQFLKRKLAQVELLNLTYKSEKS